MDSNNLTNDLSFFDENKNSFFNKPIDYLLIDFVFSDETGNFVNPCEPKKNEPVEIKIRTGLHNVDEVYLNINKNQYPMEKSYDEGIFSYYAVTFPEIQNNISYYFTIVKNNVLYYYNKKGLYKEVDESYNFKVIAGFKTPDWAKGAVMYQIFVDRFYNGDRSNDVLTNEYIYLSKPARTIDNWSRPVANDDVCNFYGGDLQGVIDKIHYLKNLGVEVIYFNPIFVSPSNHKYDIQDYDYVDPHYGVIKNDGGEVLKLDKFSNKFASKYVERSTDKENLELSNELFIKLVEIAHDNGIKVILDGVFNHCGAFNKWMDREGFYSKAGYPEGAYTSSHSKYVNYFKWYENNWPNNDAYDCWWGHDNHPKLNFEGSRELYNQILEIGKKWVSPPFNADGWRLDVGADLGFSPEFNHRFWKDFRKAVKEANPQAIILAEHYGDPTDWLLGDEWDTIMNYDAFMEPVTWFLTGMEKHSDEYRGDLLSNAMNFEESMRYHSSKLSYQSLCTAMNELSNHDHSRFLTRTNRTPGRLHIKGSEAADNNIDKGVLYEAVAVQMTWTGAPTIYYGDEAGMTGWTDPDNRRTYPWGSEDLDLINFHREMISIRKRYSALRTGSIEFLYNNYGIISYGRWDDNHKLITAVNNNETAAEVRIPVYKAGVHPEGALKRLIKTEKGSYTTAIEIIDVKKGIAEVKLPPKSAVVLIEI